jgi:hypothetical protein
MALAAPKCDGKRAAVRVGCCDSKAVMEGHGMALAMLIRGGGDAPQRGTVGRGKRGLGEKVVRLHVNVRLFSSSGSLSFFLLMERRPHGNPYRNHI